MPSAGVMTVGMPGARSYAPIRDYAILGDGRSAALVASDGSIDWYCWPRFDSPAVFCALLDSTKGGRYRVGPVVGYSVSRTYSGPTNVLTTTFRTDTGIARLTDFMPVDGRPSRILRLAEGLSGEVELEIEFFPTFDFARVSAEFSSFFNGAVARSGEQSVRLQCPVSFQPVPAGGLRGRLNVKDGSRVWLQLTFDSAEPSGDSECETELTRTLAYWEEWAGRCSYEGPYHDLVLRSALVLKLLTYAPTGALVAAPTTSLPEEIGGVRNWDYRFTWLRDSALVLYALQALGYHEEALAFFDWLESLCIRQCDGLQIMYTIDGRSELPEQTLDHLKGYRRSRPVRIGNGASEQKQLDIYGEILGAALVCFETMHPVGRNLWGVLRYAANEAAARWREPDQGIWEVRGGPRHFLYSKLLCWVALDRAVRLAAKPGLEGDVERWTQARDEIRQAILLEGYNAEVGAFTQAFGEPALDASALAVPLVGFLPASDPRVRATVKALQERLTSQGLVYRYLTGDGLPGGEATFVMCSFWLVDNLALDMQVEPARRLFERVVSYASELGLLAEEIDPTTGELLGNYPQAFTHLALIRAANHIREAEERLRTTRRESTPRRSG